MPSERIKLGMEVKDRVTGFKGIVTSRTTYLNACDRLSVSPPADEKNNLPESEAFDEPDLIIIGNGIYVPPKPKEPPGGPHLVPSRDRR